MTPFPQTRKIQIGGVFPILPTPHTEFGSQYLSGADSSLKAPIRYHTQSYDPISCFGNSMQRTHDEIAYRV